MRTTAKSDGWRWLGGAGRRLHFANRVSATFLAPLFFRSALSAQTRGAQWPLSTPIPQQSPPTEIFPAWISSDPAPTKFHSAGAFGYSKWMSGYPGGDIRHSMPTDMSSTGISRYLASTEIQSAVTFRYLAGMCGYSMPTEIQSVPIRRPVKRSAVRLTACRRGRRSPAR